jgi:hypothetical protein
MYGNPLWDEDTGYDPYGLRFLSEEERLRRTTPQTAGMTPDDAEVASWPAVPPHRANPQVAPRQQRLQPMPQQAAQAVGQGPPAMAQAQDQLTPEQALSQLRMERARNSYEQRFGQRHAGGASLASQGMQEQVNMLLDRVRRARKDGSL